MLLLFTQIVYDKSENKNKKTNNSSIKLFILNALNVEKSVFIIITKR